MHGCRSRTIQRILTTSALLALMLLPITWTPSLAETMPTSAPSSTSVTPNTTVCPDRPPAPPDGAPVLAHFYMWFSASSWSRAKTDFPAVGHYSSDQVSVVQKQVAQAQAAGIDGFMVGWKSTADLNSRLAALRSVAAERGFKLAITYQAQDFNRAPLPVAQVRADLEELAATYADDPVFHVLGSRPVVALSGTWNYSADDLRSIIQPVESKLMVLATEKSAKDYERVASVVDGELYYWSSADPLQTGKYRDKLLAMANLVREHCGTWIAPVAPGFDARQIGGSSVVDRRNGATLRSSWEAALATVPDAIGVISWNEFSENTYIEPSEKYGTRYLDVLRALTGAPPAPAGELDSSAPGGANSPARAALTLAAAVGAILVVTVLGVQRRSRTSRR
jgi:hypothetical protein